MKTLRVLRTALRALRRNKTRAILTMMGIVIGIAAVITMMEIGQGASSSMQQSISGMGANTLMVFAGSTGFGGASAGAGAGISLTVQDLEAILQDCPAVRTGTVVVRASGQLVYGNRNWPPGSVVGATPEYLDVQNWGALAEGAPFTDRDVRASAQVCLIGQTIKDQLFPGESPLGKEIRLANVSFKVVGVLAKKGANLGGQDQDDVFIAPWTSVKYRVSNRSSGGAAAAASSGASDAVNSLSALYPTNQVSLYPARSSAQQADTPMPVRFSNVNQIIVNAVSAPAIPEAIEQMTSVLRERHHTKPDEDNDFTIRNLSEFIDVLTSTTRTMTGLLLCVALISLVVGGVGIMNIMLVSVTERTREIGLRMAVGARGYDILLQFLIEAITLCLAGGVIGICLGRTASIIIAHLANWPTKVSIPAIVASVAVAGTVGILFGFYPAWRASRLNPIEALRYE